MSDMRIPPETQYSLLMYYFVVGACRLSSPKAWERDGLMPSQSTSTAKCCRMRSR